MTVMERGFTYDTLLEMEDGAAAIVATENNSGGIKDMGSDANLHGTFVVNVSAIDVANATESYIILLQGSTDPAFASGIKNLVHLQLGDATTLVGGATLDSTTGVYQCPFTNSVNGTNYRYLRSRIVIAGDSPSITYKAFLALQKGA